MAHAFLMLVTLFGAGISVQIESAQSAIPLRLTEAIRVANENYTSLVLPLKSDIDGRVYVCLHTGRLGAGPVLRISPDGKSVTRFSLEQVPSLDGGVIVDFVPISGDLVLVVRDKDRRIYLVRYDSDGSFRSTHALEANFLSVRGASFPSGDMLLSGRVLVADAGPEPPITRAFTGLFDYQGVLKKEVALKNDITIPPLSKRHAHIEPDMETRKTDLKERRPAEESIDFSLMQSSDDGNIYLTRLTARGPVYRMNQAGLATRQWELPPIENATLDDVRISKGQLIAKYIRKKANSNQIDAVVFSLMDLDSGERRAMYSHSDPSIGSAFANFSPNTFTFLGHDDDMHMMLIHADPR